MLWLLDSVHSNSCISIFEIIQRTVFILKWDLVSTLCSWPGGKGGPNTSQKSKRR